MKEINILLYRQFVWLGSVNLLVWEAVPIRNPSGFLRISSLKTFMYLNAIAVILLSKITKE